MYFCVQGFVIHMIMKMHKSLSENQEHSLEVIVELISPIAAFRLCILAVYLSLSEREVR
jgi:hypothetical protein